MGRNTCCPRTRVTGILKATRGEVVVDSARLAILAEQDPLKRAGWEELLVQIRLTRFPEIRLPIP